jgi:hypothetical protein
VPQALTARVSASFFEFNHLARNHEACSRIILRARAAQCSKNVVIALSQRGHPFVATEKAEQGGFLLKETLSVKVAFLELILAALVAQMSDYCVLLKLA